MDGSKNKVMDENKKKNFRSFVKEVITSCSNNGALIGFDELEFQASPTEFNIASLLGEEIQSKEKEGQIPVEEYYHECDMDKAGSDGRIKINPKDYKGLNLKKYNNELAGFIDIYPSVLFEDEYDVTKSFIDKQVQDKLINYDNKRIVNAIMNKCSLDSHSTVKSLLNSIKILPAKARKKTYIITNTDGFNVLDTVDEYGNKLITKDLEGNFVLDNKYIIIELDNRLLKTDETKGIPIMYGDIKAAIKKIKYRDKKIDIKEFTPDGINDEIYIRVLINDTFVIVCDECIGSAYYKAN